MGKPPKPPKVRDYRIRTTHADTGEISINSTPLTKEEAESCADRFDRFWPGDTHKIVHRSKLEQGEGNDHVDN